VTNGWDFIPNPAWEGRRPDVAGIGCHDRTPFMTIRCSCGSEMHFHISQIERLADEDEALVLCRGCGEPLMFNVGMMKGKIREAWGWEGADPPRATR
jgi:hypothetical protein